MRYILKPSAGFIYALINPSLPGLVKVGKTKRTASERANELSAATGVASPFIVVYEEKVSDIDEAELRAHTLLESKGMRLSSNREFFQGSISEIIKLISHVATDFQAFEALSSTTIHSIHEGRSEQSSNGPADDLYISGVKALFGIGDEFQDEALAFEILNSAASSGSSCACVQLSEMYQRGLFVKKDIAKSIEYLKDAAKLGNFYAYGIMANIFGNIVVDQYNLQNSEKAWKLFIEALNNNPDKAFSAWQFEKGANIIMTRIINTFHDKQTPEWHPVMQLLHDQICDELKSLRQHAKSIPKLISTIDRATYWMKHH